MDIYNLTNVDTTMDGKRGVLLQGFNIIGSHGRPLVTLSFHLAACLDRDCKSSRRRKGSAGNLRVASPCAGA